MNSRLFRMMNFFKDKLISFIERLISNHENKVINSNDNPYGILFEDNSSYLLKPLRIEGGNNIVIGKNCRIGISSWIGAINNYANQNFTPKIVIEDNVNIGDYACITSVNNIVIGKGCLLSEQVYLSDHTHGFDPTCNESPSVQRLTTKGSIVIGENTFIGIRACILPGVKLGKFCVVGANSVVTKSFDDYTMIAGSPAKSIKKFDFDLNKWVSINESCI